MAKKRKKIKEFSEGKNGQKEEKNKKNRSEPERLNKEVEEGQIKSKNADTVNTNHCILNVKNANKVKNA